MKCAALFLLTLCTAAAAGQSTADPLKQGFEKPPQGARPRVWWHWMGGNISKEGVQLDVDWMHRVGIGGFQAFEGSMMTPNLVDHPIGYMTPDWNDAFKTAIDLGHKYGMEIAIAGSPGWSESGGPWVQPRDAMKKIVWSELRIPGGVAFRGALPHPPVISGAFQNVPVPKSPMGGSAPPPPEFYADSEVIAYRAPAGEVSPGSLHLAVTGSAGKIDAALLSDGDLTTPISLPVAPVGQESWIQFEYPEPQAIRAVTLATPPAPVFGGAGGPSAIPAIQASEDGAHFRSVAKIKTLTHGFAPNGNVNQTTVAFPPATARYFRVAWTTPQPNPQPATDSGAGMFASRPPTEYRVTELVLHPGARVHHFEEKVGFSTARDLNNEATPAFAPDDAIAKSDVINLTRRMRPDGTLDWTPPSPGEWVILRFGYSLTGAKNSPAPDDATGPEVDKFDHVAVKNYLEHYIGLYQGAIGDALMGEAGLSYMVNDSWEAGNQTWTADMVAKFTQLRGYDPRPWMPVLAGRVVQSAEASDRFLWDYRKTIADLIATEHYGQIEETLHEHRLKHYTESHEDHRAFVADGMEVKKLSEVPMGAMWTSTLTSNPVKVDFNADDRESASVAHIYGQNIAAAESMTSCDPSLAYAWSPATLKPTADQEFINGINRFAIHESAHQPFVDKRPGMSLGPCGQWFNRNETWADEAGAWIDYLARNSFLLQQGRFVADIAYYYGEDSNITALFGDAAPSLPAGYNFDYVNADALIHELAATDGRITTQSGMSYRVLALDKHATLMSLPVLRALYRLVEQGAIVAGDKPSGTPSLADDPAEFARINNELFGTGSGLQTVGKGRVYSGQNVEAVLKILKVVPDFDYSITGNDEKAGDAEAVANDQQIAFIHRRLADRDLYLVDSRGDKPANLDASFRVTGKAAELWHAETGAITPASFAITNGRTTVPLHLEPWESVFVVFRTATTESSRHLPATTETQVASIAGPWTVSFQEGRGAPASIKLDKLISWSDSTDEGVKFFSGKGTYSRTIEAKPEWFANGATLWLDLGQVKNLAVVTMNGKQLGTVWRAPYRVNLTPALKPGANQISVTVINSWVNRIIGDRKPNAARQYTFTSWKSYSAKSPLQPSGLLGPVTLVRESTK